MSLPTLNMFAMDISKSKHIEKVPSLMPSPSRLAPTLVCFAFIPKKFPEECRRFFEIRHRLAFLLGVKELVEDHGCSLSDNGFEKRVGKGMMDAELLDDSGNPTVIEATGSDWIKIQKIIQACLYRTDKGGRVWVSSINERLKCPTSLAEAVTAVAPKLVAFKQRNPEVASRLYMPHRDVCPLCDNRQCPHMKPLVKR